jgi:hypothetical protein
MVRAAFSKIRTIGPAQLTNGRFAILFVADLRVGMGPQFLVARMRKQFSEPKTAKYCQSTREWFGLRRWR